MEISSGVAGTIVLVVIPVVGVMMFDLFLRSLEADGRPAEKAFQVVMCLALAAVLMGAASYLFMDWKRADVPNVEVESSVKIASFGQSEGEAFDIDASAVNLFVYGKAAIEGGRKVTRSYEVYEDVHGDGGLRLAEYPAESTVIYEDCAPGDARVEEVRIAYEKRGDWLFFEVVGETAPTYEVRIHVPEGSVRLEGELG